MRNEKEVIQMQTRREFLKKSAALLGSAAVVGSVPGLLKAQAEDGQEVPAYPYPYVELDPAYVEKLAYEGYFENGCCFGVAKAILVALREKVGYPYTVIPEEMFANGKEGYTCGTLKVKVTMDGDKIAKIDILSHGDTAGVCNAAYDTVPGKIIDAQSTNVDAATGATISSKAIMAAVEDALSKVGK